MTDPERPECYANLDRVFPLGPEGLRVAPDDCLVCFHKTDCLRDALAAEHQKAMTPAGERPVCFADLLKVFPKGADGLRVSPDECFACDHKTACLKAALAGEKGLIVENERVDRAHLAGSMGFLARWSKKKSLNRRLSKMPSEK